MFSRLKVLEARIQKTVSGLKKDQKNLNIMRVNWNNLGDKTQMNQKFADFVKIKVNELEKMFYQSLEYF